VSSYVLSKTMFARNKACTEYRQHRFWFNSYIHNNVDSSHSLIHVSTKIGQLGVPNSDMNIMAGQYTTLSMRVQLKAGILKLQMISIHASPDQRQKT
jgi:hypothetical protein